MNAVFSENGIIKKAELAKSMHANSVVAEEESMNSLLEEYANMLETNSIPDDSTNSTDTETPTEPDNRPLVNTITTINHEIITAKDAKGNQVVIPGGFKIAEDSGTTVQQGIVIEDSEENQFVWIPVSNINNDGSNKVILDDGSSVEITLGRYSFDTTTGAETLVQKGSEYDKTSLAAVTTAEEALSYRAGSYYYELTDARESNQAFGTKGTNSTAKDLAGFISSVETNKGYYLARYEASYANGSEFGVGESETYYKPASKTSTANSTSMSYTAGTLWNKITQGNASMTCRQMYYGDTYVESDLCNSYAWDTAIVYIQAMGNSNYANTGRGSNTSLNNTGVTGDEKCKIFDMAGNIYEWTTEYSTYKYTNGIAPCTFRGGVYSESNGSTADRNYSDASYSNYIVGFRPALYCKTEA